MQSLIISWAVCARLALINKYAGANVLAVETVMCDTSIIPAPVGARIRVEIMASARCVSRDGSARRAVDKSEVTSPWRLLL